MPKYTRNASREAEVKIEILEQEREKERERHRSVNRARRDVSEMDTARGSPGRRSSSATAGPAIRRVGVNPSSFRANTRSAVRCTA